MERFNVYCLKKMWVGLLGWIVLSYGAMSYADLFKAIEQGNIAEIRLLLNNNPSQAFITQVNDQGQTVLHRAFSSQNDPIEIVELLLDKVNNALTQDLVIEFMLQVDKNGATATRIASEKGHIAVVSALLGQFRNLSNKKQPGLKSLNRLGNDCVMSLFYACSEGQIHLVRFFLMLLTSKKTPEFFNGWISEIRATRNGWTPLHAASERGHVEVVNMLLAHNLSSGLVMHVNNDGQTALHLAAAHGHVGVVNVLLAHNASLQLMMQKDNNGNRAARIASEKGHIAVVAALIDKYKLILEQPSGPNSNDVEYDMAMFLFYACRDGQMSVLQLWLLKVTNFAVFNRLVKNFESWSKGLPPLHLAAVNGHVEAVNALLAYNPSSDFVTQVTSQGQPAGSAAAYCPHEIGDVQVVNGLLVYNSSPEVMMRASTNKEGLLLTTYEVSRAEGINALLKNASPQFGMRQYMLGVTALHLASARGHVEVVKALIAHNLSSEFIRHATSNGSTALHLASQEGHVEVVKALLLAPNASFEFIRQARNDGSTALHLASARGHVEVVKALLLAHNSSSEFIRQARNDGSTALHLASEKGHVEVVNVLLAHDASLEFIMQVDKIGWAALHLACLYGHKGIVVELVSVSRRLLPTMLSQKNASGISGLEMALERGKNEIADYLAQKIIGCSAAMLSPGTTIPSITSFAQLNADREQKLQNLEESHRRDVKENKDKLLNLLKGIEDAQQKKKHPSSNRSQELSVSVKQELENDQEARMRNFYEDLDEDQLIQVAEKARGKSVATKNCVHLAKAIIDFLRTGHPPTGIASEEESTHEDFQTLVEYEAMPSGSGPSSKKRKKNEHVIESTVVDLGVHEDSMPGRYMLHLELDEQGNIAHSCEEIDLSHREVPSQRVTFDDLDKVLKEQAKGNPHEIAFGLINLGRVRDEGDIHIPVGHQFVYFARRSVVYLIDPQNRSNNENEVIFSGTNKWKASYLNKVKETFGEYAFVVPMTMNF